MVSADLERLRLPHNQPNLPRLLVLQKLHRPNASLLPLIPFLIKSIEFRFPLIKKKIKSISKVFFPPRLQTHHQSIDK